MKTTAILLMVLCVIAAAQTADTFTDTRDGKTYRTVKIGEQVWMAENLNYETDSSWCYDDNPDNCKKYGRLYKWETAKVICPKNWHLPVNEEWEKLIDFTGGRKKAVKVLMAKNGWAALFGGFSFSEEMSRDFGELGTTGFWWSASVSNNWDYTTGYEWLMRSDNSIECWEDEFRNSNSVRCLRD